MAARDAEERPSRWCPSSSTSCPRTRQYRVIFMERDLDEMILSQEKMLARLGKPAAPAAVIKDHFIKHLAKLREWLAGQRNIQVIYIRYSDLVEHPEVEATRVSEFLDGRVQPGPMAKSVDPSLYRNRKPQASVDRVAFRAYAHQQSTSFGGVAQRQVTGIRVASHYRDVTPAQTHQAAPRASRAKHAASSHAPAPGVRRCLRHQLVDRDIPGDMTDRDLGGLLPLIELHHPPRTVIAEYEAPPPGRRSESSARDSARLTVRCASSCNCASRSASAWRVRSASACASTAA